MVFLLYQLFIQIYYATANTLALFDQKPRRWVKGRKGQKQQWPRNPEGPVAWFHCASLGEFEQGRELLERFRQQNPEYKVLLTFFSPSGYDVRKNYEHAEWVFYFPLDTYRNARRFIDTFKPSIVFFIKYDFWYNSLRLLKKRNIPVFLVSAKFREDQVFFRWYGRRWSKVLKFFSHLFVQDLESEELLDQAGIFNVSVAGDTRFDRVLRVADNYNPIPVAEAFAANRPTIVAGSTWPEDEALLAAYLQKNSGWKLIIAPHEVNEESISRIIKTFSAFRLVKYSDAVPVNLEEEQVLLVDKIGLLSSLYRAGTIAYVGGGFEEGIHNILEPAAHGKCVFFGPNHYKFLEAKLLIARRGGFEVKDAADFGRRADIFLSDPDLATEAGAIARAFVEEKAGATDYILSFLKKDFLYGPGKGK